MKAAIPYRMVSAASRLPLAMLERMAAEDLLIPVYHTVSDRHLPHIKSLYPYKNVDQFISDLDFFAKRYSLISLDELLESHQHGKRLGANTLLLTFDDGLREVHDIIAPILLEKKIPATFFLTTCFLDNQQLFYKHKASLLADRIDHGLDASDVARLNQCLRSDSGLALGTTAQEIKNALLAVDYAERHVLDDMADGLHVDFAQYLDEVQPYLTTQQVEQLIDQGFTIGAHSLDHPVYSSLPLDEQVEQTVESMRFVAQHFMLDYKVFAFPFNDRGISHDFFDRVSATEDVDVFFGTSSMVQTEASTCYQRTIMETLPIPAPSMIAARYMRKLVRQSIGRNQVDRKRDTSCAS